MSRELISGDLNARITIERDATVRSASGSKKAWETPETVVTAWARMEYGSGGSENSSGDTPVSIQPARFWIRRRTDILPKMRVKFGSRTFEIQTAKLDVAHQQFMAIEAIEVY